MGRPHKRIDYIRIMMDYFCNKGTIREVARLHKAAYSKVAARSSSEKWAANKVELRESVGADVMKKLIEAQIRNEVQIDGQVHRLSAAAMTRLEEQVEKLESPTLVRALAGALDSLYRLQRETAGLPVQKSPTSTDDKFERIVIVGRDSDGNRLEWLASEGPPKGPDAPKLVTRPLTAEERWRGEPNACSEGKEEEAAPREGEGDPE